MNPDIFKAYDIRGKYPSEINENIVAEISNALVKNFKPKKIVVGYDARLSSPSLYKALIKSLKPKTPALLASKQNLKPINITTTPMFYFLVNYFNADLGIMITASHNPKEYNGMKIVSKKAIPISGKEIIRIMK